MRKNHVLSTLTNGWGAIAPFILYLNYYSETKLIFYMFRIFLILLLFISFNVFAHQPKLVNYSPTKDNPYEVINPEISKAYYRQAILIIIE